MLDTYWLIQGARVSLPLESVRKLAISDELDYIELADGVAKPPADANPDNDLIDARAQIRSDPYFNLGQTSGWIGLLDTGVRRAHTRLQRPDHIAIAAGPDRRRRPGRPVRPRHRVGRRDHRQLDARRQLARRVGDLASTRGTSTATTASSAARDTVEGFEKAVSWLDKVIVAEIQLNSVARRARPRRPPTPRSTPARS